MGCFDTIYFKKEKHCVHCGASVGKDFQTKSLGRFLTEVKEGKPIPKFMREHAVERCPFEFSDEGFGRVEAHTSCPVCKKYFSINVWMRKWKIDGDY